MVGRWQGAEGPGPPLLLLSPSNGFRVQKNLGGPGPVLQAGRDASRQR
jgi:hypothetical protein